MLVSMPQVVLPPPATCGYQREEAAETMRRGDVSILFVFLVAYSI